MKSSLLSAFVLCGTLCATTAVAQAQDSLTIQFRSQPPAFVLTGATFATQAAARAGFYVTVQDSQLESPPPLMGRYELQEECTVFTPRFPLSDRVSYRVHLKEDLEERLPGKVQLVFSIERAHSPTAKVAAIYPSANTLPDNVLKFYIHFSEPMERGRAYQHLELLHDGEPVSDPFLELGEELWDGDQQRFTLFMHPGRIKQGLRLREDTGPAIEAGGEYTLRVRSGWTSALGTPLVSDFEKTFRVKSADHQQPAPERWQIATPRAGTQQPVALSFDEPLDHAMLQRVLDVRAANGESIPGAIEISQQETRWEFTPAEAWPVGRYNILVAANLEDSSGNSIARPFEVKMQDSVAASIGTQIGIEFFVK